MRKLSRPQLFMIAAFLVAAVYIGFRIFSSRDDGRLRASGTIEAIEVDVSPEMGKQPDSYEMIHGKTGLCLNCHKTDAAAMSAKAPTSCKACHGGAE